MKHKARKSSYAAGAPPCPVRVDRASRINQGSLRSEYNGLLITIAAMIEANGGQFTIPEECLNKVKQGRVIQILVSPTELTIQFDTFGATEANEETDSNFLESQVAKDAREFLSKQKDIDDNN
jgi:hypothetical protein